MNDYSKEVKKDLIVFNYSDESWAQAKFDFRKLKIVNF